MRSKIRGTHLTCKVANKCLNVREPNTKNTPHQNRVADKESWSTHIDQHHLAPVELKAFQDIELCVVAHLKQHTKMRDPSKNSGTNQLLLSCVQPRNHQSQQQLFQDGMQPNWNSLESMLTYLAFIQLRQRQHQGAKCLGYRSQKSCRKQC